VALDRLDRSDRRLLRLLRRRDPAAVHELYERYGRTTFGFLLRALPDRGAAEDVQQQVFLEVWERGATYDPKRASLLTWIMTITRSRAIDHLRRRVPEPRDPAAPAGSVVAVEDHADALVEQWHVVGLLSRLPREEAELLRRRFYDGLSQREIADATGMPLGTVKMRMVDGLQRLRVLMEAEG
jgi:RNA polymerase sigma-70 factor, ECF subfamily